jgi:hypothetical protein
VFPQRVLEIQLAGANQHNCLRVLLLHEESNPLGKSQEVVGRFGFDPQQMRAFEIGKGLVEVPLFHVAN